MGNFAGGIFYRVVEILGVILTIHTFLKAENIIL